MPGGKGNINGEDGKKYSTEYQPRNRRKSTKFLTELLIKELKGKREIEVEGFDVVTGAKTKIKVPMPTMQVIVGALLRQAGKGNVIAIKEIMDRVEGKTLQPIGLQDKDGNDMPLNIIFQPADGCEDIKE